MDFEIVDIPKETNTRTNPLIEAMVANVGKAISVPCANPNSVRKSTRMALSNRGLLEKFSFHSRISADNKAVTIWLELKPVGNGVGQDGTMPERMR